MLNAAFSMIIFLELVCIATVISPQHSVTDTDWLIVQYDANKKYVYQMEQPVGNSWRIKS